MIADVVSVQYKTVILHIIGDYLFYVRFKVSANDSSSCKKVAKCFLRKIISAGFGNCFKNEFGEFVFGAYVVH